MLFAWRQTKGFTILELMMTIIIISILAGLTSPFAANLYNRSRIDEAATGLIDALQRAQSSTAGQRQRARYSVYLQSDRFVFFPGSQYLSTNIENEVTVLPSMLTLSWSLNGGGSTVVFDRGNGKTGTYGTVTLTSTTGTSLVIAVDANGQIYVQ